MITEFCKWLAEAGNSGLAQWLNFLSIMGFVSFLVWLGRRLHESESEKILGGTTMPLVLLGVSPLAVHVAYATNFANSIELVLAGLPLLVIGYIVSKFGALLSNPAALQRWFKGRSR